jgi:MmpS family membrane protein
MTDSPHRQEPGPAEPSPYGFSGASDPAYLNQPPYGTSYPPQGAPAPTQQLPAYAPNEYGYTYETGFYGPPNSSGGAPPESPPPDGPPSRRWLWVLAAGSLLTVLALVIAVVIISGSEQQVVVAPPLIPTEPDFTTPSNPPTTSLPPSTTTPAPPSMPIPIPIEPSPSQPGTPGETQTVVYTVSGRGRAISITYVDTGGVLQTEFNVLLPWSKQVELASPAESSASVNIINFGRRLTCSISVAGDVVVNRTGAGLTVCGALG